MILTLQPATKTKRSSKAWNLRFAKLLAFAVCLSSCNLFKESNPAQSALNRFEKKNDEAGGSFRWVPQGVVIGEDSSPTDSRVSLRSWAKECDRVEDEVRSQLRDRFDEFDCGEHSSLEEGVNSNTHSMARVSVYVEPDEEFELLEIEVPKIEMGKNRTALFRSYLSLAESRVLCKKAIREALKKLPHLIVFAGCESELEISSDTGLPFVERQIALIASIKRPLQKSKLKPLKMTRVQQLIGHGGGGDASVFTPIAKQEPLTALTVGSGDGIAMWNLKTGQAEWIVALPPNPRSFFDSKFNNFSQPTAHFTKDNSQFFIAKDSGHIFRMSAATGEVLAILKSEPNGGVVVQGLALSEDEQVLFSLEQSKICSDENVLARRDISKEKKELPCVTFIQSIDVKNTKRISLNQFESHEALQFKKVEIGESQYLLFVDKAQVSLFNAQDLNLEKVVKATDVNPGLKKAHISAAEISSDGRFLAVAVNFGVAILELSTGKVKSRIYTENPESLENLRFIKDGDALVANSNHGTLFQFDLGLQVVASVFGRLTLPNYSKSPKKSQRHIANGLYMAPKDFFGKEIKRSYTRTRHTAPSSPAGETIVMPSPFVNEGFSSSPDYFASEGVEVWKIAEGE